MFSTKTRYALRAVLALVEEGAVDGREPLVPVRDLAEMAELPAPYLAKIVQELAAAKILKSRKGPGGGVTLRGGLDDTTVADIVFAMDQVERSRRCLIEDRPCREVESCALHETCRTIREDVLEKTTLADLLASL